MKSFINFLTENTQLELKHLETQVDQYLKQGEILNPDFESLKSRVNKLIDKANKAEVIDAYIKIPYDDRRAQTQEIQSFYYDASLSSYTDLLSLGNKFKKIKLKDSKETKLYLDAEAFYQKYSPLAMKLKELKGKIVKVSQKRAEIKQAKEVELKQKFTDSSVLVKLLDSYLKEYLNRVESRKNISL